MQHRVCPDCVFLGLGLYVFTRCSNGEHCRELKMCFGGQKTTTTTTVMLQDWTIDS